MARTLQDRFFENLDQRLAEHGCEAIVQYVATNTGRWRPGRSANRC